MVEKKYDHYIVTGPAFNKVRTTFDFNFPPNEFRTRVAYLDNEVVKGAFYVATSWFWKSTDKSLQRHCHEFDEVLGFFGTNPEDVYDLCGEIELWLNDEQYLLKKSFLVFIPKGLLHCPLFLRRVDRPIFHFSAGLNGMYGSVRT